MDIEFAAFLANNTCSLFLAHLVQTLSILDGHKRLSESQIVCMNDLIGGTTSLSTTLTVISIATSITG